MEPCKRVEIIFIFLYQIIFFRCVYIDFLSGGNRSYSGFYGCCGENAHGRLQFTLNLAHTRKAHFSSQILHIYCKFPKIESHLLVLNFTSLSKTKLEFQRTLFWEIHRDFPQKNNVIVSGFTSASHFIRREHNKHNKQQIQTQKWTKR